MNAEDVPLEAIKVFAELESYINICQQKGRDNKPCYSFPTLHRDSTEEDITAAVEASMLEFRATVPRLNTAGVRVHEIVNRVERLAAKAYIKGLREAAVC